MSITTNFISIETFSTNLVDEKDSIQSQLFIYLCYHYIDMSFTSIHYYDFDNKIFIETISLLLTFIFILQLEILFIRCINACQNLVMDLILSTKFIL